MKIGNKTLNGKHAKTAKQIQSVMSKLKVGDTIISIDPSSTSLGYAIFELTTEGWAKIDSGAIKAKGAINERLHSLSVELGVWIRPSAVFVELIGGSTGHKYLVWSVGMVATTFPYCPLVEVQTGLWKKFVDKNYSKSDENDAIAIGNCAIEISKHKEPISETIKKTISSRRNKTN